MWTIRSFHNLERNTQGYVLSYDLHSLLRIEPILIDAYLKVSDAHLSNLPFLVSDIKDAAPPLVGKYFPGIYNVKPSELAIDDTFLVNHKFMESCCGTSEVMNFAGSFISGLADGATDNDVADKLSKWKTDCGLQLISVYLDEYLARK
jgi:hypothetical protein